MAITHSNSIRVKARSRTRFVFMANGNSKAWTMPALI
jgi:hypothetical protein